MKTAFTYATRRSLLALAQCRALARDLCSVVPTLTLRELQIVTTGDRIQDRALAEVGGKGLFVKEIEEALLDGRADFAVHSMKDVPGQLAPGLVLACVPKREDPRDVLVAPRYGTLDDLPRGARVGTSSLRRAAALGAYRRDLVVQVLRGNVDTRLRKVDAAECDAIVLARAGLVRLGLEERVTQVLPVQVSLPAPGQGALAVECRETDSPTRALVAHLHDPEAATCVAAERGVLIAVGGDCKTPLGAYAQRVDDKLHLLAFVATVDAKGVRHAERTVPWPATEVDAQAVGFALGGFLCAG